ncbi:unnamed protein product [Closterium sp. Naga37s-1]|nr:unnamed protein product [Closterium sp. Naga37s-1]
MANASGPASDPPANSPAARKRVCACAIVCSQRHPHPASRPSPCFPSSQPLLSPPSLCPSHYPRPLPVTPPRRGCSHVQWRSLWGAEGRRDGSGGGTLLGGEGRGDGSGGSSSPASAASSSSHPLPRTSRIACTSPFCHVLPVAPVLPRVIRCFRFAPCYPLLALLPHPFHPCFLYLIVPHLFHPYCPYPVVPHPLDPCCLFSCRAASFCPCCPVLPVLPRSARVCPVLPLSCPVQPPHSARVAPFCPCCPVLPVRAPPVLSVPVRAPPVLSVLCPTRFVLPGLELPVTPARPVPYSA